MLLLRTESRTLEPRATLTSHLFAGGRVSLASSDPFDSPLVHPNLLGTDVDIAIVRTAIKSARAFMAAPAWSDYIISEFGAFAQAQADDEIDAYARDNADTVDHPVGTVRMGRDGALTSDLRVKGTTGLRVVDASALVSGFLNLVKNLCCR